MIEWYQIILMTTFGACFSIGGTGYKWVRRYLMPGIGALILWGMTGNWLLPVLSMIVLGAFLLLGYGETVSWPRKFLVGCSYVLPSLFFGYSWWILIYPLAFISIFWASNQTATAKSFVWKVCEFMFGSGIAFTLIGALQNRWL